MVFNRADAENEMGQLQRLVSAYLDVAEDMAQRHIPMTMEDWETRLSRFIEYYNVWI